MAQKAMQDMESLVKDMRQARTNVNRLVQTAPTDKPVFLVAASMQAEAKFRQARTGLNLWTQKHFRGGEEWSDQPEQMDQCEPEEKLNLGHCHLVEMVEGGHLHSCKQMTCQHFSTKVTGIYPEFNNGHDELGVVGEGEMIWTCPDSSCRHLRRQGGEDEVDFSPRRAQLQLFYPYSDESDTDSSSDGGFTEGLRDDVYSIVCREIDDSPNVRRFARADAVDYIRAPNAELHDAVVDAYLRRNMWSDARHWVQVAYPNC